MKLSEAIREGAKLRPQARGNLYQTIRGLFRSETRSCALGAAFEAAKCESHDEPVTPGARGFRGVAEGQNPMQTVIHQPEEWTAVLLSTFQCPQCVKEDEARYLIPHLNDDHKWTREEIALWVERAEKYLEAKARQAKVVCVPEDAVLDAVEIG